MIQIVVSSLIIVGLPSCNAAHFYNTATSSCEACHALCTECTAAGNGNCQSCVTNADLSSGSCTCLHNYYQNGSTCQACDLKCDGCTAAGGTACTACAIGKFNIDGTSVTCVNSCGPTQYASGWTCYGILLFSNP